MRIGVDARCLSGQITGIGRYVREILLQLDNLMPQAEWFLYSHKPIEMTWPSKRWQVVIDAHPIWRRLPGSLWVKWRLATLVTQDNLSVFWAAISLSPRLNLPIVATVYDLNHLLVPETMPLINRVAYRRWFNRDVCAATKVVAISKGTADRLSNLLGRIADDIAAPGSRWALMSDASTSGRRLVVEPYILAVATKEPRKNLASLVAAFAKLKSEGFLQDHRLVLVGASGWGQGLTSVAGTSGWLRELGYVEDHSMAALYVHADLFVQPSFYEGFGMPAAEAASFGVRVVATDIPELREAAGANGVFVEPSVDGIAQGILRALAMPKPVALPGATWSQAAGVMKYALERASERQNRS